MSWGRGALVLVVAIVVSIGVAACGTRSTTHTAASSVSNHPVVYTFGVAGTEGPVLQTQHEKPTPIRGIEGTVTQIATSNSDTYALTSTGTVWAWGVGSNGELGNGATPLSVTRAVQVDFPGGVRVTSLPNPMPFDGGLA